LIFGINLRLRFSWKYREWRDFVFKRDNYTCQECGKVGGELNADHIIPFAILILNKTYEQCLLDSSIWDINNGRTLCKECHKKTDTYGLRLVRKMREFKNNRRKLL
jgi:5-methylcytosine-specific restriction endonuclease McrA